MGEMEEVKRLLSIESDALQAEIDALRAQLAAAKRVIGAARACLPSWDAPMSENSGLSFAVQFDRLKAMLTQPPPREPNVSAALIYAAETVKPMVERELLSKAELAKRNTVYDGLAYGLCPLQHAPAAACSTCDDVADALKAARSTGEAERRVIEAARAIVWDSDDEEGLHYCLKAEAHVLMAALVALAVLTPTRGATP